MFCSYSLKLFGNSLKLRNILFYVQVTERMMDSTFRDQDFIIESVSFMVDWKNKFIDAEECIKTFHVYISTCPGGKDYVYKFTCNRLCMDRKVNYLYNILKNMFL